MKRLLAAAILILVVGAVAFAAVQVETGKLPKCQMKWCRDIGCPPDVLCSTGTAVKSCYDICNGK